MLFNSSKTAPSLAATRYESHIFNKGLFARGLTVARCTSLCVLPFLCGRHGAVAQGGYTITDLGVGNQWYSEAHGLNNGGWAVGEYEPVGALYQHGFLY